MSLGLGAALACLSACVISPESDWHPMQGPPANSYGQFDATHFQGFASDPGATVTLHAVDHLNGGWDQIDSTTASTSPIQYGGQTLYVWNFNVTMDDLPSGGAIYFPDLFPATGGAVTFQVREVGGSFSPLLTFDVGGLTCTTQRVGRGDSLIVAAWSCKAAIFDQLTIFYRPYI